MTIATRRFDPDARRCREAAHPHGTRKIILIVAQCDDPHIEQVSSHLLAMGALPVLFDISAHTIALCITRGDICGYVTCDGSGERVALDRVHGVWFRFKQWGEHSARDAAIRSEMRFARSEWLDVLNSLGHYVALDRYINPPSSEAVVATKAAQYLLAARLGFRVPETVITNKPESVLSLLDRHGRIIYKPNAAPDLTDCRCLFTTEIGASVVRSSADEIALAPGIYQELIEKDHELRVTVVGEKLFAARIDSQQGEPSRTDWRRGGAGNRPRPVAIGPALSAMVLAFHRHAGLVYGAYDFAVSKSGKPVFLEVNPAGQWMWMDELFNPSISMEVAARLNA